MISIKPVFLLFVVFLLGNTGFVLAQTENLPPEIINPILSPVKYCSDSVPVAKWISIKNIQIDDPDEGMKVSIANYVRGEDQLVYEVVEIFKDGYSWNDVKGELEIRGIGSDEDYREAISKVYYKNIAHAPSLGIRSFSISLLDADYLPETEHFYRYISLLDITWKEARDSAANMEYYGLKGYLTTITSNTENDFIWTKVDGVGWIGASDEDVEGQWKWVTGPEAGTLFWQGNENGSPVPGQYNNWNTGEPNNLGGEDYAHINMNPNTIPKSWNDLRNAPDPNSQYYRANGFIVEFGDMPGDPEVKLSATASVEVAKIAFSAVRDYVICEGESVELNLDADNSYSYAWTPAEGLNNPNLSNPLASPLSSKVYKATGTLDFCTDTALFTVQVDTVPISKLRSEEVYCKGESITLDPGVHGSYEWSTGANTQTITVDDENVYWVRLSNEYGCANTDTVEVKWSIRPEIDYSAVDTLVCGSKEQTLNLSFVGGADASTVLIPLDPDNSSVADSTTLTPTITVRNYGKYRFEMQLTDEYSCEFLDTLNIEFHNQPEAKFDLGEEECKGYNLQVEFKGETVEDALFSWYYNDSVYVSEVNLKEVIIPLGFGELNRSVGLKVNEQGCVDSSLQNVTVTPNVEIVTDLTEGCTPLLVEFEAKATEAVSAYLWVFGDGNTSTEPVTSNSFMNTETGDVTFDVSLTVVSTEGCENTGTMEDYILVHPKPTVDLSFDEADCNPEQMEIFYTGSGNENDRINWDLSAFPDTEVIKDPGTSAGPLEIKRSSEPTAAIGVHVVSEFECKSDTLVKVWKRVPLFEIDIDTTEGCPPLVVNAGAIVLDSVDQVNFTYDLGDGTSGNGDFVEHSYTNADANNVIRFEGTSNISGCKQLLASEEEVNIYPVPTSAFTPLPESVVISDPLIEFQNETVGAIEYEWDFGDMSAISTEVSPIHQYSEMGFYDVLLFAYNDLGCMDSISKQVVVAFDKLFPPNAFSPNATLEEDREFRIYSDGIAKDGYHLRIFNRWGEVIFESLNQENGWDGKMKNDNFAPAGVYTWVLQYTDFRGEGHMQQGTVTLLL